MEELGQERSCSRSLTRRHKDGYDIELTRAISEAVTIPIIASGGAGTLEHLYDAFAFGKADAAPRCI